MHFEGKGKVFVFIIFMMFMETIMSTDTRYIKMINAPVVKPAAQTIESVLTDTIPFKERMGDFINDKTKNPIDIFPSTIKQKVEYDPETNQYVIYEKIGDEYYRTPTYMTFDEYMEWSAKEQEKKYFDNLAGIKAEKKSESGKIDPMEKIDVSKSLVDRLFGGNEINIKPQGSVDLSVGWLYSRRQDPSLPIRAQRQSQPEIRQPAIRMNVNGSIGKKLNLDFNYDTQANFNFDQLMKIGFNSDNFSEDDIIKKIEAGNVNLPLRGNLIKGAQSLFGVKMELQFARLRLTGLVSQQRARQNNLRVQNGNNVTEFEIYPDEYDENRHFFISHFNRNEYEKALEKVPFIATSFQIAQIEVWISDDRPEFQANSTLIGAIADLGEGDPLNLTSNDNTVKTNCKARTADGKCLPFNNSNNLYREIIDDREIVDIDKVSQKLKSIGLVQSKDFEVFRGRKLNPSEYTFHPKLGTISLNARLRANQVLGVAYNYYYTDKCDTLFQVGQLASSSIQFGDQTPPPGSNPDTTTVASPKVHFVKLIKPINQNTNSPLWDLMMKNVYPLRTSQLNSQDFEFDVFYENDFNKGELTKYIPEGKLRKLPLLQAFNLDRLNRYGDPQPDGIFDYIPGVTVIENTGSVIFPVLEPFGRSLKNNASTYFESLQDPLTQEEINKLDSFYVYNELYDTTITIARQSLQKNKFVLRGKVKGSSNGIISLGPFVPRGSVRVTAGGKTLVEGQDYEIDYSLANLRIINETYLAQGTPVNVSFEDNSVFNFQQKTMNGLRAEYTFDKNTILGATYLRYKERPFTGKITIGDDPVSNQVIGVDFSKSAEVPWITKMVDKLPFYSTKEKSNINFTSEAVLFLPGHNKFIDGKSEYNGIAHIDDFEGAITGFNLGSFNPNQWILSSTPPDYISNPEPSALELGANRAKLAWYVMDLGISPNNSNPYTRQVLQTELFKLRETPIGQNALFTFDLSYYPEERGPYNFDTPAGYPSTSGIRINQNKIFLNNPKSRWAGIMRYFQNPDFEQANYEFIEFWVLNPFMARPDGIEHIPDEEGEIVFQLGNVSEDILKDDILFFENALPTDNQPFPIKPTVYGRTTTSIPLVNGFDLQEGKQQDLGFDGIDNAREQVKFESWLTSIGSIPEYVADPSGDDFVFFNDPSVSNLDLLEKMKNFNGSEGNAPLDNNTGNQFVRGNRYPETEDMNNNRTLDKSESHYEYKVKIKNNGGFIDTTNLRYFKQTIKVSGTSGGANETWYRFVIPLSSGSAKNGISGFRSIQFMRMYLTNFERPKVFRMAEFQLLRSQWRRQNSECTADLGNYNVGFTLDEVGLQENSERLPFNYITPAGIVDQFVNQGSNNIRLDEKSLSLIVSDLRKGCTVGASKITRLDINQYKRLQLFVHAENKRKDTLENGEVAFVLRLGKDFVNNYYEYQIPLKLSNKNYPRIPDSIWIKENFVDINLDSFLRAKTLRNKLGVPATEIFSMPVSPEKGDTIRIIGNPSLGLVKVWYVGLRSFAKSLADTVAAEVWVNELRLVDFRENPAFAAQSRLQIQMADLGEINLSGNYSSQGYGGLDQRIQQRQREEVLQYDAAINVEAGKLLPKSLDVKAPIFAQYSQTIITPQYDAFDRDIEVKSKLKEATSKAEEDEIRERNIDKTIIKTFTVTNLKINKGKEGVPWAPKNFGFSYSFTDNTRKTPIIKEDKMVQRTFGFDYVYTRKSTYFQPLKFIKSNALKLISEFNLGLLPNNFSFNSKMVRLNNSRTFRLPEQPVFLFEDLRFTWDRNYSLDWDLTKSIRFNFRANATSLIDELRQSGIEDNPENRKWFDEKGNVQTQPIDVPVDQWVNSYRNNNIKKLGRSKFYNHNASLSYRLPFSNIPILNWINSTADYKLTYGWEGGSLQPIDELGTTIGNVIQNSQNRGINTTFSFDKLYNKWNYLKSIETGKGVKSKSKKSSTPDKKISLKDAKKGKGSDMSTDEQPDENQKQSAEPDADGKKEKKDKKKEDKPRDPTLAERIIVRPLLSLRSVKFNYKEELTTMIPGYMQESKILGLNQGFEAPGFDFVAGIQPRLSGNNNWLQNNKQWFNDSKVFNNALQQNKRHNFDVKILVEPFKDFSIDVNFNKNYNINHTEVFRAKGVTEGEFLQLAKYDVGGFDASYIALNTLFENTEDLYSKFKENRIIISKRLPNIPGAGLDSLGHAFGYGPLNNAVNIPAFIATYTKQDPNTIALNQREEFSKYTFIPKPNWQVNYTGLSKLKGLKNIFSNITIKHGYRSTVRVNRFETQPNFKESDPLFELSDNGNYFSRFEIPDMAINESFAPLLGISVKTKSDFKFDFEFKKTRNLALSQTFLQQSKNTEIVLGSGYVWKNFKGFSKKSKSKKSKKTKKATSIDDAKDDPNNVKKGVTKNRELKFNMAFSYRDDESLNFNLADGLVNPRADRGSTTISFNPTLEYDLNKNLALRYYFEYSLNRPKTTNSFPVTTIRTGIMFRFNLQ
ncbi:MAG: cell surface protein SprA [Saprospiraceae bacterium]|nr:cell surface protein SprA [Saprospiraceae bacterium]